MPTYDYICQNPDCLFELEVFQSMKDEPLVTCSSCGQNTLKRKIGTGAGILFKGSGFYETDYKRKPEPKAASGTSSEKGTAKADTSKKEAKPVSTTASTP